VEYVETVAPAQPVGGWQYTLGWRRKWKNNISPGYGNYGYVG